MAEKQTLTTREDIVSVPENLVLLDTIFSAVLIGGLIADKVNNKQILLEKSKVYQQAKNHFKATFQDNVFVNEYDIFYQIITLSDNTKFSPDELKRILMENKAEILKSKHIYTFIELKTKVKEANPSITDDEFFDMAVIPTIVERYIDLSKNVVDYNDYLTACDRYIQVYKERYMFETAENMSMIVQGGDGVYLNLNGSNRLLRTTEDCMNYYTDRVQIIRRFDEERNVSSFVYDAKYIKEAKRKSSGDAVLDYGVAELDSVKSKMRRGNMICIMGPPKGGKTTFTTYLAEKALSQGLNVAIWPLEGTPEEWIALLTASAIACGHISQQDTHEVSKTDILYGTYKSEEDEVRVNAAQYAMAEASVGRGRLSFLTGVAYVEDFEEELTSHYENVNRFDVIIMDSPINMQTRLRKGKSEFLSQGFMNLKNYVANKMKVPALCIVTAQYKQDVVDLIRRNPNAEIDVTAGGETAESIRTPDDVIGLFSNATERENRMMKVYDIASRSNGHFEPFYMGCSLGCAKFWSDPELN